VSRIQVTKKENHGTLESKKFFYYNQLRILNSREVTAANRRLLTVISDLLMSVYSNADRSTANRLFVLFFLRELQEIVSQTAKLSLSFRNTRIHISTNSYRVEIEESCNAGTANEEDFRIINNFFKEDPAALRKIKESMVRPAPLAKANKSFSSYRIAREPGTSAELLAIQKSLTSISVSNGVDEELIKSIVKLSNFPLPSGALVHLF